MRSSAGPALILLAHGVSCNASRGDVALVEPGSPHPVVGGEPESVEGDDFGQGAGAGPDPAAEDGDQDGDEGAAVDPPPIEAPGPSLVAPSELQAYRCESAAVRGRTPDDRPAVLCAGPGLGWSHQDAETVPCERCARACDDLLPAGEQCARVEVRPDESGVYSELLTSAQLATGFAQVCVAHADGSALTATTRLTGFGWIGGWIEPRRPNLGPDFLGFEGRVCAQLESADERALSGATLGFSSDWPTVFVDRQGTTDARGVGCAELVLTGAVRSDVQVQVTVTSECPGGPPHFTVVPVEVVANPPSAAKSRLDCTPSVLPAFDLPEETTRCELTLIDRFGELVLTPVEVGLATEAGRLSAERVVSEQGRAVFTLSGGDEPPRDVAPVPGEPFVRTQAGQVVNPRDGYVSLIAWWQGEEGFTDDSDGFYSPGEPFIDLPEPWVDMDDDGAWSGVEPHVDQDGLRPDIWDAGNLQWDSHAVVWTETRVIFTDAPDPAGALDQGQGCQFEGPVPESCGQAASAWRVTSRPCRFSFPLHDRRLNPPAGLDTLELRLGALRPLPLLRAGEAGWAFHRAGGVIDAAFTRVVGFFFDGVPSFSAHLDIRGLDSGPVDLSLAIGGQVASVRGCVDP